MAAKITPGIEEYLEALFHLQRKETPISTKELAEHLGIAPASVTEMIKKLANQKLVSYVPYRGVTLTKNGRKAAAALVRRHRLSERFLADMLGVPWEDLHEEACKFEHVISDKVEKKLLEALGNPKACPHGNPIPTTTGEVVEQDVVTLASLKPTEEAVIVKITDEKPEFLQYLGNLGLLPRVPVRVEGIAPFNGPILVRAKGATYALGQEVAREIWVTSRGRKRQRRRQGL